VINGLEGLEGISQSQPFEVFIVGDDTYGKPVGSQSVSYSDSTLLPITFRLTNRKGVGDYFEGLTADSYIEEDIKIAFGDPDEKLLKEVLYYIENEQWTGAGKKKAAPKDWLILKGLSAELGAI
jgi:hypothetical protein